MKRFKALLLFCSLFLLVACTNEGAKDPSVDETKKTDDVINNHEDIEQPAEDTGGNKEDSKDVQKELPLISYFMKDGTIAHYKGEGNEFAQYTTRTEYLDENYINIYEDNGGTSMLRTYRIEENQIVVVKQEGEFYEDYHPDTLELESLEPEYVFLKTPLEVGTKFEDMKIVEVKATVETPYQTFDNLIIVESTDDDGNVSRSYIVEGFGEVKREFITTIEGVETIVSSSLESIEEG